MHLLEFYTNWGVIKCYIELYHGLSEYSILIGWQVLIKFV